MDDENKGIPSWLVNLAPVVTMVVMISVAWGNIATRLGNIEKLQAAHLQAEGHGYMLVRRAVIEQSLSSLEKDIKLLHEEIRAMRTTRSRARSSQDYYNSKGQTSPP